MTQQQDPKPIELLLLPEWIGTSLWNNSLTPRDQLEEGDLGVPTGLLKAIDAWGYAWLVATTPEERAALTDQGRQLARRLQQEMGPQFTVRIFAENEQL